MNKQQKIMFANRSSLMPHMIELSRVFQIIEKHYISRDKVRKAIEKEIWQLDCRQKDAETTQERAMYIYAIDRLRFIIEKLDLKGD